MLTSVSVHVKAEGKHFKQKFLHYSDQDQALKLSTDCPELRKMVDETLSNFKDQPDDVIIKAEYVWQ